ncbi:MEI2 C-terminal RRM only like 1 [Euphorbia peplus]|nr:MEI2 C-terminal RRM only like 1 [Euphorbia peplus]
MASQRKKLNPNATPYTIFPHSRFIFPPTPYQIISVPLHPNVGYTYVSQPFYLPNLQVQPGFVPRETGFYTKTERGFQEVKTEIEPAVSNGLRKIAEKNVQRHVAPRVGCNQMEKKSAWVEKDKLKTSGDDKNKIKLFKKRDQVNFNGRTSLMIKNIPNQLQRHDLLQVLEKHCLDVNMHAKVKSTFDFVYLPMDFRTDGNFGYAFVNFTKSVGASRFFNAFNGYQWDVPINKKTCKICFAKLQGKAALTNHFKNSVFQCKNSEYLPVVLSPPRGSSAFSRIICMGKVRKENQTMLLPRSTRL